MTHGEIRPGSGEMFDAIADRYDLLNRILSLGIDQGWRRATVASLQLSGACRVLDVATGTADLALAIAEALPGAKVVGVDPSPRMLEHAEDKTRAAQLDHRIEFQRGSVEELAFDDASFDATTIAFGIRNAVDRLRGLKEMRRVTRPGGRVAILELAEPEAGLLRGPKRFYIRKVVPFVGGLVSGSREYRYLQTSVSAFPTRERFVELMHEAGLRDVEAKPLTLGAANLFVGQVP